MRTIRGVRLDIVLFGAVLTALAVLAVHAAITNSTDFSVLYRTAKRAHQCDFPFYRLADVPGVFRYFPAVALVLTPFARLDFTTAAVIWAGICLSCLGGCLYLLPRCFPPVRPDRTYACLAAALVLTAPYIHYHFMYGQMLLPMLFLLLLACFLVRRDRPAAAGAALACAVSIKVIPAFMGVWFLTRRNYRALAWAVIFGMALLAIPVLSWGWHENLVEIREWLVLLGSAEGPLSRLIHQNQSLYGLAARLAALVAYGSLEPVPNDDPLLCSFALRLVGNAMRVAALAWYGWVLWRLFTKDRPACPQHESCTAAAAGSAFAAGLIIMILLPPIGWIHYFVVLLPANFILMRRWIEGGDRVAGLSAAAAFVLGGVVSQGALGPHLMVLTNQLGAKTIAAIVIAFMVTRPERFRSDDD